MNVTKFPFLSKLVFTYLLIIPFLLFLAVFVYFSYTTFRVYTTFQRTQGTITPFVSKNCGNRASCKITYSKIVEYQISNQKKSFEAIISETNSQHIVGSIVPIFYNPSDPSEGVIHDEFVYLGVMILSPIYIISATFFLINLKIRQNNLTNQGN